MDEDATQAATQAVETAPASPEPITGHLKQVKVSAASHQRLIALDNAATQALQREREAIDTIMEAMDLRGFYQNFDPQTGVLTYIEPVAQPVNRAQKRRAARAAAK